MLFRKRSITIALLASLQLIHQFQCNDLYADIPTQILFNQLAKSPQTEGPYLLQIIDYEFEQLQIQNENALLFLQGPIGCTACSLTLQPVQIILKNQLIRPVLEYFAYLVCKYFKIYNGIDSVCKGAIHMMADELLPAIADGVMSPQRVCNEKLRLCNQKKIVELDLDAYVQDKLSQKPDFIKNNSFINDIYKKIKQNPNDRKIVRSIQFSDLHVDFKYQEGLQSDCNYPICCRDNGVDQIFAPESKLAGKWGDYNCDLPHITLKNMFDFIGKNQDQLKIDFITWVGDNSAHNVWDNTNEEVTDYTVNITQTLKQSLGPDSKIQVYPIHGNHDTWPVNVEDFSKPNSNYPINHFRQSWTDQNWLSQEESDLFGQYGYYSKQFNFNQKGRVIGLNMQTCNDMNWWLLDNRQDPGHQIQWLEEELLRIENDNGFAYLIAHIPGSSCLHQFGMRYKALMERFQHIVRFSSFGHSHDETFYVTNAINTTNSIGWSFVSGSGTAGGDRNPAFTIIDWDEEFMVPVNTHTFYMNLSKANSNPEAEIEWSELHDLVNEYSLEDLSPKSMSDFADRMQVDTQLAQLYEWNKSRRGGDPAKKPIVKKNSLKYKCMKTSERYEKLECMKNNKAFSFEISTLMDNSIENWIQIIKP